MPSLVFDECCGCIELKTGCFIIGYLYLVLYITSTIFMGLAVGAEATLTSKINDVQIHNAGIVISVVLSIVLIFLLLALIFTIVLLVGLHKNNPGLLKMYLVFSVVYMVLSTIVSISICAMSHRINPVLVIRDLLDIVSRSYFLLVIRSRYFNMKDPAKQPGPAIYYAE